jgi:hypothetical protein
MRYRLRRDNHFWVIAPLSAILLAFVFYSLLDKGFAVKPFFGGLALAVGLPLLMELAWRKSSWVTLHESHLEISRYMWGQKHHHLSPNVTVSYSRIRDVQILRDGHVAVFVDSVESPYEMTSAFASVTFRPNDADRVVEDIRTRVAAAKDSHPDLVPG